MLAPCGKAESADHISLITSSHLRLRINQFVVKRAQRVREHSCAGEDGHEISVSAPARYDVNMQIIDDARARAFAKVDANIEPLRLRRGAQKRLRMRDQIPELNNFILAERGELRRFAIRHRHQMTNRVGVTVHHQKRVFAPRNHQMRGVIARPCRRFEKIPVARFLLEILHPPRTPERL